MDKRTAESSFEDDERATKRTKSDKVMIIIEIIVTRLKVLTGYLFCDTNRIVTMITITKIIFFLSRNQVKIYPMMNPKY